jgi:hypothetical protein
MPVRLEVALQDVHDSPFRPRHGPVRSEECSQMNTTRKRRVLRKALQELRT